MRLVKANVACLWCSLVNFCSVSCRDEACDSFHVFECKTLKLLLDAGLNSNAMLAFRLITKAGPKKLWQLKKKGALDRVRRDWGAFKGDVYESDDFINAFHHSGKGGSLESCDVRESLVATIVSVFLLRGLASTAFFEANDDGNRKGFELFVGSLLLHFLRVLPANGHDIGELELAQAATLKGSQMTSLGAGVFNTLSLFNHSCNPIFMRANAGDEVICVTVRDLKAGEEVTENYGLSFLHDPFAKRQEIFQGHYGFTCSCEACSNAWPTKEQLKNRENGRIESACDKAIEVLNEDWEAGVGEMRRCLNLIMEENNPSYSAYRLQNAVWEFLWLAMGNKRVRKS